MIAALIALVASATLVIVSRARLSGSGSAARSLAFGAGALVLAAAVISISLKQSPLLFSARSDQLAWNQARHFHDLARKHALTHLIILQGSSRTFRGVDGRLLEKILRQNGLEVVVAQLALGGANHFEQYFMLKRFLHHLRTWDRRELTGLRVLRVQEISKDIDWRPANLAASNADSDRVHAYLDAGNTWDLLHAIYQSRGLGFYLADATRRLAKYPFLHAFSVGAPQTLITHRDARGFKYRQFKIEKTWQGPFKGLPPPKNNGAPAGQKIPAWLVNIEWPRERALLSGLGARTMFHYIPSLLPDFARYARSFCRQVADPCIDSQNSDLARKLDHPKMWIDRGHLQPSAARLYTRWLAGQILSTPELLQ